MDVKTRELLVLAILTALGQTGPFKSHVLGNLKIGNSLETQCAVIMQAMPYCGIPNAFGSFNVIKQVAEEMKK